MPRTSSNKKVKNKKQEKYIAENEIIIGVTTKQKETKQEKKKSANTKSSKTKGTSSKKPNNSKNNIRKKTTSSNIKKNNTKDPSKDQIIKKLNRKRTIISLVILSFICCAGIIYFLTTPMFNITNIEISGNKKISVETYISLTQIELNTTNIFAVTKRGITKNIKENPYVETVEITRKLPNIIQINIKEREVAYQAKYNNKNIYMDKQGYILEVAEKKKNTITLLGLSSTKETIEVGQRLNKEDLIKLDTVLKIVNYFKYNSIESDITSINVADSNDFKLNLEKEGKTVHLGNETILNEKILKLKAILEKEKGNKGEIFIDEEAINRNRIYFKPIN